MNNNIINIKIKIMVNESLYKKGIIDEETYSVVKERLFKEMTSY